jgi:hypothetical protein
MADVSPFAEGRSRGELSVNGVRCPRTWSRKPCPGRRVEKASSLTKERRMESSVASSEQGHGAIAMAARRGRGVPPSEPPQWSAVRRAGRNRRPGCSTEHPSWFAPHGAPLPLLGAKTGSALLWGAKTRSFRGRNRKENLTLARDFRSENAKTWLFEKLDGRNARAALDVLPSRARQPTNCHAREGGRSS